MNDYEKVQELQKCADRHRQLHEKRRKIEWKILFSALALIIIATWSLLIVDMPTTKIKMPIIEMEITKPAEDKPPLVEEYTIALPAAIGYLFMAFIVIGVLRRFHLSNQINMDYSHTYEDKIEEILDIQQKPANSAALLTHWLWQSLAIALVAICCAIILIERGDDKVKILLGANVQRAIIYGVFIVVSIFFLGLFQHRKNKKNQKKKSETE